MKRILHLWSIGGLLTVGLLAVVIGVIDEKPVHEAETGVGRVDADASLSESSALAPALEPESAPIPDQAQAAVEFDPEVEALSDADIESRMAGLPARQDYREYAEHLRARGWKIPFNTKSEYERYDYETLESMAEAGDFIALSALDSKIVSDVNPKDLSIDNERLFEIREKGAVFGMTTSSILQGQNLLDEYAVLLDHPGMDESPVYKKADPRKRVVDGLAWLDFSASRGDLRAVQYMADAIADPRLAINEEDLQAAKVEAQRIYQRLSEQRKARGLPEFDNHISPGAMRLYEHTLNTPSSLVFNPED